MSQPKNQNWLLTVAYKGTGYSGWQIQPNNITIQEHIEQKLSHLFSCEAKIFGCSRTDAGVHALAQMATFFPPVHPPIKPENAFIAMNNALPNDIRIQKIELKPDDFHARFKAVGKTYSYVIYRDRLLSPFMGDLCWHVSEKINIDILTDTASYLVGKHDFTTFSAISNAPDINYVKEIYSIKVNSFGKFVVISITGNSFLYKMVRRLVGYLIKASTKNNLENPEKILESKNRNSGFDTAPPQGLYLEKIFYSKEELNNYDLTGLPFLSFLDKMPLS